MSKKRISLPPIIGGNSLLLIFAVLCLTVLTLLMLYTAISGGRMSDVSAKATSAYYEADLKAEETLALLRGGELPEGVEVNGGTYSYEVNVSDTYILSVEANYKSGNWQVTKWKTYSTNR